MFDSAYVPFQLVPPITPFCVWQHIEQLTVHPASGGGSGGPPEPPEDAPDEPPLEPADDPPELPPLPDEPPLDPELPDDPLLDGLHGTIPIPGKQPCVDPLGAMVMVSTPIILESPSIKVLVTELHDVGVSVPLKSDRSTRDEPPPNDKWLPPDDPLEPEELETQKIAVMVSMSL